MTPLTIAIVNNMPDAALRATERQFAAVFADQPVRLRYHALPGILRTAAGQAHVTTYAAFDALVEDPPDGMIVTGLAPRLGPLQTEPWWPALARLADWAERRAVPTLWSCLAAHAAVLHLDGVARRPLPARAHGVYAAVRVKDDPLLAGLPTEWRVPHSRWNEVPSDSLEAAGYRVLAVAEGAGADVFARPGTPFTFFQGHPEYDGLALLREYRRDVARALDGSGAFEPRLPCGCLSAAAEAALRRAQRDRVVPDLDTLPPQVAFWHDDAVRLYAGWLGTVRAARRVAA